MGVAVSGWMNENVGMWNLRMKDTKRGIKWKTWKLIKRGNDVEARTVKIGTKSYLEYDLPELNALLIIVDEIIISALWWRHHMKMLDILQALCEQGVSNNALNCNVLISPDTTTKMPFLVAISRRFLEYATRKVILTSQCRKYATLILIMSLV